NSRVRMKVVRPRALLYITAICLLLAAGTVWAQRPPFTLREPAAAQKPPLGKTSVPGQKPVPWKTSIVEQLGQKAAASQKPAASQKAAVAEKAAFAAYPQFELLSKVVPGLSPGDVSIVPGTVKRFSQDWETGAKNPKSYLPQVNPELLSKWNAVPQEKRIFIIGAGKDSAEVSEAAKSLQAQGNAVFFYDFCRPLCSSEAVGAMAGTSGQIMLYRTRSAELSKYVEVEVATARFLDGLAKPVILISTEELFAAKTFQMHVAEMRMPTPSPAEIEILGNHR